MEKYGNDVKINQMFGVVMGGRLLPALVTEIIDDTPEQKVFGVIFDKHCIQVPVLEAELKMLELPKEFIEKKREKLLKAFKKSGKITKHSLNYDLGKSLYIQKGQLAGYKAKVVENQEGFVLVEIYDQTGIFLRTAEIKQSVLL